MTTNETKTETARALTQARRQGDNRIRGAGASGGAARSPGPADRRGDRDEGSARHASQRVAADQVRRREKRHRTDQGRARALRAVDGPRRKLPRLGLTPTRWELV